MRHLFFFIIWLLVIQTTHAHGMHDPKKHDPQNKATAKGDTTKEVRQTKVADSLMHGAMRADTMEHRQSDPATHTHGAASMNDFPTLHPLIVHFPIMFLLIVAAIQLVQFFVFKRELSWVALVLLILGFIGAYVSAKYVHPHTHGLSLRAAQILKEHDLYAYWTVWLSGIGSLFKIGSHFMLKGKVWAEIVVAFILLGAAYSVAMAGHHGAQLVHIEGVGPQGKFLELHHE
jgi:uncharacterized membrane protein